MIRYRTLTKARVLIATRIPNVFRRQYRDPIDRAKLVLGTVWWTQRINYGR